MIDQLIDAEKKDVVGDVDIASRNKPRADFEQHHPQARVEQGLLQAGALAQADR